MDFSENKGEGHRELGRMSNPARMEKHYLTVQQSAWALEWLQGSRPQTRHGAHLGVLHSDGCMISLSLFPPIGSLAFG